MVTFPELVLTATGAFVVWAIKGFKGKFDDEMVHLDKRHSIKGIVRLCIGTAIWIAALWTVSMLLSEPERTEYYEYIPNAKGELKLKKIYK